MHIERDETGRRSARSRLSVCLLVVLAGGGCARYHAKPIGVQQSFEDLEARRLDAPELGAFLRSRQEVADWPPDAWDLYHLTLAAFYYSPALDVARAQWGVAEGGVVTAGGRPNPAANLSLGYNSSADGQVSPWIPDAVLDLPLDVAGKRGIRVAEARHRSEAARLNLISTGWQVRSRLRRGFLELYVSRESALLLARQQDIQTETLRILEARLTAGEASPTEVTRARIDLARSRVAALSAEQDAARARVELADALGVPPAALDAVGFAFDELGRVDAVLPPIEARRRALVNRSDILGALAEYEASQSALQLEVRRQYPDINLGAGYQLDQTDNKWTLGLGLVLPLLNRNQGPIAEAAARREEAGAVFLALQSSVLGEVESSVILASSAVMQVQAADTLLEALRRSEATAQATYDAGEISRLELLGLQSETIVTSQARLEALVRAQQALGALEDAMQIPVDVERWVAEAPRRTSETGGT